MWYDKSRMRMLFFFGAGLAFIGLGLITMEYTVPGAVAICFGIAMIVIAFAVLRLHLMVGLRRK